jgi:hypothetical protein
VATTGTASAPTANANGRGGVPEGYPLDHDVVAPLVITTVGADPIPVTGTDGTVHVTYELEVPEMRAYLEASIRRLDEAEPGPLLTRDEFLAQTQVPDE